MHAEGRRAVYGGGDRRQQQQQLLPISDQTYNIWVTAPNLVEMTHIADTVQPLLNVVPVKGRTNDYLHHVYTERHYVKTKRLVIITTFIFVLRTVFMKLWNYVARNLPSYLLYYTLNAFFNRINDERLSDSVV